MRRVILASHGGLATGALDTVHMIVGDLSNVYAFTLLRDDILPISGQVRALLNTFDPSDEVFILTDMVGSSVNNDMVSLLPDYPQVTLIAGMNMPLILTLATEDGPSTPEELAAELDMCRAGLKNCSLALREMDEEEGDDLD